MKKIVVGITGASGIIYGVRVLEALARIGCETHLVVTEAGRTNLALESGLSMEELGKMARHVHDIRDITAAIASGSYQVDGMIVAPCSIKTLSAVANSYNENLLVRAADVMLKERRKLVLLVRETPLHEGHLKLMLKATRMGAVILPPVPAFYNSPRTIDDIVNQTVGKVLDQFSIEANLYCRWGGG